MEVVVQTIVGDVKFSNGDSEPANAGQDVHQKNDEYPIKVTRELELYGRGDESSGRSMASII